MFFNDSEEVDKPFLNFNYSVGDRLFYSISIKDMNTEILQQGLIIERLLPTLNGHFMGNLIGSYFHVAYKSLTRFDFAEKYLVNFIKNPGRNDASRRANYNSTSGYFKFGKNNIIYNSHDAGNFMWGRAMRINGFSYFEAKWGSRINSIITLQGFDTKEDQEAIKIVFSAINIIRNEN